MKRCNRCQSFKWLDEFYRNRSKRDGVQSYCKPCWNELVTPANKRRSASGYGKSRRAYHQAWTQENREHVNAKARESYHRDLEQSRLRARKQSGAYRERVGLDVIADRARVAYHADIDRSRSRGRQSQRIRRARVLGSPTAPYSDLDIFERDAWTCGLCSGRIDRLLPRGRWSASVDHVIPVARGGADTPENVQAAHLGCNSRKRDRVPVAA